MKLQHNKLWSFRCYTRHNPMQLYYSAKLKWAQIPRAIYIANCHLPNIGNLVILQLSFKELLLSFQKIRIIAIARTLYYHTRGLIATHAGYYLQQKTKEDDDIQTAQYNLWPFKATLDTCRQYIQLIQLHTV